jgi:hypothetical protein
VEKCPRFGSATGVPDGRYWEAWPVAKGMSTGGIYWSIQPYSNDTNNDFINKDECGIYLVRGTLKFFCRDGVPESSGTGDLGELQFNPTNPRDRKHPFLINQRYLKGTPCELTPGLIPSTPHKPAWWDDIFAIVGGPAERYFSTFYNCCPCPPAERNFVHVDAGPRK